ncbi:hypothetical protein VTL71DRAFT_4656 [Oculimacula yallundae]|uniref:Uncharacterized protein n=1 Tax=Oculimacula yallundae TaxID=86028 RepID=A0ABR4C2M1_9HELO
MYTSKTLPRRPKRQDPIGQSKEGHHVGSRLSKRNQLLAVVKQGTANHPAAVACHRPKSKAPQPYSSRVVSVFEKWSGVQIDPALTLVMGWKRSSLAKSRRSSKIRFLGRLHFSLAWNVFLDSLDRIGWFDRSEENLALLAAWKMDTCMMAARKTVGQIEILSSSGEALHTRLQLELYDMQMTPPSRVLAFLLIDRSIPWSGTACSMVEVLFGRYKMPLLLERPQENAMFTRHDRRVRQLDPCPTQDRSDGGTAEHKKQSA